MCDILVRARDVDVSDSVRKHAENQVLSAVSVFDHEAMNCSVTLRNSASRSADKKYVCETTLTLPKSTMYVKAYAPELEGAIDVACSKLSRKLRRRKTRIVSESRAKSRRLARGAEKAAESSLRSALDEGFEVDLLDSSAVFE